MTQILKNGTLVTLKRMGGIGVITDCTMRPGTHPPHEQLVDTYQVYWSQGPDKQFHIDECWVNPTHLEVITDGS